MREIYVVGVMTLISFRPIIYFITAMRVIHLMLDIRFMSPISFCIRDFWFLRYVRSACCTRYANYIFHSNIYLVLSVITVAHVLCVVRVMNPLHNPAPALFPFLHLL